MAARLRSRLPLVPRGAPGLLALGALLLVTTLGGCAPRRATPEAAVAAPPDQFETCCSQCRLAASQDPQGRDLSLLPCADYRRATVNGAAALTEECAVWLGEERKTVAECAVRPML